MNLLCWRLHNIIMYNKQEDVNNKGNTSQRNVGEHRTALSYIPEDRCAS
jgi:hypothetical protein